MSDTIEKQIMDLREVSERVDNYISEHNFIDPTTNEQIIDNTSILLHCRLLLLEELEQFGILPTNYDELILDGYKLRNAINLREVFDEDFIKMFITGLNDIVAEEFKELLQNKYSVDKEFGLENISGFILDRYPANKKFQMMKYYASDFYVNDSFYTRLFNIFENTIRFITETNEDNLLIADYLKYKFKHINNVRKASNYLIGIQEKYFPTVELRARLAIHDHDLISSDKVREVALLWRLKSKENVSEQIKKMIEELEIEHHRSNRHHLEYFINGSEIELIDKIEIVSDIYNEQATKEQYINDVKKEFENIDISEDIKNELISFANQLNLWEK